MGEDRQDTRRKERKSRGYFQQRMTRSKKKGREEKRKEKRESSRNKMRNNERTAWNNLTRKRHKFAQHLTNDKMKEEMEIIITWSSSPHSFFCWGDPNRIIIKIFSPDTLTAMRKIIMSVICGSMPATTSQPGGRKQSTHMLLKLPRIKWTDTSLWLLSFRLLSEKDHHLRSQKKGMRRKFCLSGFWLWANRTLE